jgi:hypothetical protein
MTVAVGPGPKPIPSIMPVGVGDGLLGPLLLLPPEGALGGLVAVAVGNPVGVSVGDGVVAVFVVDTVVVAVGVRVGVEVLDDDDVGTLVEVDDGVDVPLAVGVSVTVGVLVGGGPTQSRLPETTDPSAKIPDTEMVEKLGPEIGPIVSQFGWAPLGAGGGFSVVGPPDPDGPPRLTVKLHVTD